jgi:hypothetical protein
MTSLSFSKACPGGEKPRKKELSLFPKSKRNRSFHQS